MKLRFDDTSVDLNEWVFEGVNDTLLSPIFEVFIKAFLEKISKGIEEEIREKTDIMLLDGATEDDQFHPVLCVGIPLGDGEDMDARVRLDVLVDEMVRGLRFGGIVPPQEAPGLRALAARFRGYAERIEKIADDAEKQEKPT